MTTDQSYFVLELCTSRNLGGLELYFFDCCKNLPNYGLKTLNLIAPESKLEGNFLSEGLSFRLLNNNQPKIPLIAAAHLSRIVKRFNCKIIHVHHKRDLFLAALTKIFHPKIKIIHTRQMLITKPKKGLYHSFIYRSIDKMIAITEELKDRILKYVNIPVEKVCTLYYGVKEPNLNPESCNSFFKKFGKAAFNIALIGRIDRKKDQHVLIKATAILKEKGIDVMSYVVGGSTDDDYKIKLEALINDLNLVEQVIMTGFQNDPQRFMNCFDVVVLTTAHETFGLVLAEAMRAQTAVVGANNGGVLEIIENGSTGLLFEAGDEKDLARMLLRLYENRELKENLAKAGKLSADKLFNQENHFLALSEIIKTTYNNE